MSENLNRKPPAKEPSPSASPSKANQPVSPPLLFATTAVTPGSRQLAAAASIAAQPPLVNGGSVAPAATGAFGATAPVGAGISALTNAAAVLAPVPAPPAPAPMPVPVAAVPAVATPPAGLTLAALKSDEQWTQDNELAMLHRFAHHAVSALVDECGPTLAMDLIWARFRADTTFEDLDVVSPAAAKVVAPFMEQYSQLFHIESRYLRGRKCPSKSAEARRKARWMDQHNGSSGPKNPPGPPGPPPAGSSGSVSS